MPLIIWSLPKNFQIHLLENTTLLDGLQQKGIPFSANETKTEFLQYIYTTKTSLKYVNPISLQMKWNMK